MWEENLKISDSLKFGGKPIYWSEMCKTNIQYNFNRITDIYIIGKIYINLEMIHFAFSVSWNISEIKNVLFNTYLTQFCCHRINHLAAL